MSRVQDVRIAINVIEECIKEDAPKIAIAAANIGNTRMKQRVFKRGLSFDGTPMGLYRSESHAFKRFTAGRQIAYKDLFFSGSLSESIVTDVDSNVGQIGFNDADLGQIGRFQEENSQTGKKIWGLNDGEVKVIETNIIENWKEKIAECLKRVPK